MRHFKAVYHCVSHFLNLSKSIQNTAGKKKQKTTNAGILRLFGKKTCPAKSLMKQKDHMARNICAILWVLWLSHCQSQFQFYWNDFRWLESLLKPPLCVGAGRIWFSSCFCSAPVRCVSPALTVVCMAFLCTGLWKQLWLWFCSQQNAWMAPS